MNDNILDELGEIFKHNPQQLTFVEEQIDIDIQIAYFKSSQEAKNQNVQPKDTEIKSILYNPEASTELKKDILISLASMDTVEAYRVIEQYHNQVDDHDLKSWSSLALKESKMMMESSLLDQRQILISTGLGGKDSKLRYFIVLSSKNGKTFDSTQKKVITNEFEYVLSNNRSVVERIEFDKKFSKILSLIPLDIPIKETLVKAIEECNNFGDFINDNFIVTNVKELSTTEIEDFLSKKSNDLLDDEADDGFDLKDFL